MIRYAVMFPSGSYSNGPARKPVPLEKAKLWRTRGQVTQHLDQRHQGAYPPGCVVVKLHIEPGVEYVADVGSFVAEREAERQARQVARNAEWARLRFEMAKQELERARKALGESA